MNDIAFKSQFDGTAQHYIEILPTDFTYNKKYSLIIALHGHGADRKQFANGEGPEFKAFREIASKYEMIAVSPDYRSKTSWMGPAAEADMVQLITDFLNKYKINKVFIVGASMGGTSALTFTVLHPELVNGITAMNAHANHIEYNQFQDAIAASFGGGKEEIPEEYKKRSAEFHPEKFTMPVAFAVGENDTIVPPQSILRLVKKLEDFNPNVLIINRPEGGHSTNFNDAITAMEFMIKNVYKSVSYHQATSK